MVDISLLGLSVFRKLSLVCIDQSGIKVAQTEKRVRVDTPPSSQNRSGIAVTVPTDKTVSTKVQSTPARSQRWVPPTSRENLDPTELIFRKIRG